jgi:uncharacterized protein (TIRG00374 family)
MKSSHTKPKKGNGPLNRHSLDFKKWFKILLFIIPIGVVGNLLFSFSTLEKGIWDSLAFFTPRYLFLAIILGLVPWLTNSLRIVIWTRFLGARISLKEVLSIVLGTELGSAISPTAIGGGYVKMGMLIQKGLKPGAAASLMTLGSVEDGVFFALAIPVAFIFSSHIEFSVLDTIWIGLQHSIFNVLIVISVLVLILFILKNTPLSEIFTRLSWLEKITSALKKMAFEFVTVYKMLGKKGKSRFALSLCLTAVQWTCRYSVISALLACFQIPIHPVEFFLFQWIVFTLMTFVPTPGGSVGAEAAFYFIYHAFIPRDILGIATAGWRFLTYYFQLSLGSVIFSLLNINLIWRKKGLE